MQEAFYSRPSLDLSQRFPLDERLRGLGYTIAGRPERGEVTWEKGKKTYTQREVLARERI